MRFLFLGNFTQAWDTSTTDESHVANSLEAHGHSVYRLQREKWDMHTTDKFDFVLVAQWDKYPPEFHEHVKTFDAPVVYWAFDFQDHSYQHWHHDLIKTADVLLTKELENIPRYREYGTEVYWLSQDFAPNFLNRHSEELDKDIDVLFTGTYLEQFEFRNELLKAVDDRFDLHIYSINPDGWERNGFKNVHPGVFDEGLPELIARAKINLSVDSTVHAAGYWSDRNAQIMACGGFALFYWIPFSETVFRDNVAYFYNVQDGLDKIEMYLSEPIKREIIAERGHEYARSNLLAKHRVKDLITILEGYRANSSL